MNNNERQGLRPVDQTDSMMRHPSRFGETPDIPHKEAMRRHADERLRGIAVQLHDFFRFGDPAATPALEVFLQENETGRHAEVLLDELNAVMHILGVKPEQGAA